MFKNLKLDLEALYGSFTYKNFLKGLFLNPSFQAVVIIRLALNSGKFGYWFFRNILIMKNSIDVGYGAQIGGGLYFPHPINIVIGKGCVIGKFNTIYQGVTIGQKKNLYPVLCDHVKIYPNSMVIGDVTIFEGKRVPPMTLVEEDYL